MNPHLLHLKSVCELSGKNIADIGAGKGVVAMELGEQGAWVTGVEIDEARVHSVQKRLPSNVSMKLGRAENLPIGDGTQDVVCFFFSFHHVPIDLHDLAIFEAVRVLKPGGRLHVVDPLVNGTMSEVLKFVEDETHVRTVSHARMSSLTDETKCKLVGSTEYSVERSFRDFDEFVQHVVAADQARAAMLPHVRPEMKAAFTELSMKDKDRYRFSQPCRAYHFELA
ncbi:MAG: class I SAM-dependent methyltransferase [Rhizobiaceae bacterium]